MVVRLVFTCKFETRNQRGCHFTPFLPRMNYPTDIHNVTVLDVLHEPATLDTRRHKTKTISPPSGSSVVVWTYVRKTFSHNLIPSLPLCMKNGRYTRVNKLERHGGKNVDLYPDCYGLSI